jgi:hypothetical protein
LEKDLHRYAQQIFDSTVVLLVAITTLLAIVKASLVPIMQHSSKVVCAPATWGHVLLFYLLNYGAHRMPIKSLPRAAVDKVGTWLEELFAQEAEKTVYSNDCFTFKLVDGDEMETVLAQTTEMPSNGKQNHYRHDIWEKKNALKEHILLDRRREAARTSCPARGQ